jgi:hypothetical protein
MNACPWENVSDFQSYSEFERFVAWMNEQLSSSAAEELPVREPYVGATAFHERWFRHVASGTVWRLVWPDPPFTGIFEQVV